MPKHEEGAKPCPNCGYCPTCGHSPRVIPAPYPVVGPYPYQVYPYQRPYWLQPYITVTSGGNTAGQTARGGTYSINVSN